MFQAISTRRDLANPASLIGSAAMLLAWLGERRQAPALLRAGEAIERAVDLTIKAPELRTRDLGGPLGTRAFASCVAANLAEATKTG